MPEPLLEARAVGKLFPVREGLLRQRVVGHVRAVQAVSFALAEGTTLAVVGESGCGKTTLMRLVLRQERPTSGQVYFRGADVHAARPAVRCASIGAPCRQSFRTPGAR